MNLLYGWMAWLVALAACHAASGNREAGLSTSSSGFSISLQRLPGPHKQPAYTLTIDEYGQATYSGGQNAQRKGAFYRKLTIDEVNALAAVCRTVDWPAQATQVASKSLDVQASVLTYTPIEGKSYRINHKDQLSPALKAVEQLLEEIGRVGEWKAEKE